MKIIITESQFNLLVEAANPCPEGKKEDDLITLDQLKKGSVIEKGYCNSNSSSAIVKIQIMMQEKGLLDNKSNNGYYGDKTQDAVKKLFEPSVVEGTKIGPKTLEKLKGELPTLFPNLDYSKLARKLATEILSLKASLGS